HVAGVPARRRPAPHPLAVVGSPRPPHDPPARDPLAGPLPRGARRAGRGVLEPGGVRGRGVGSGLGDPPPDAPRVRDAGVDGRPHGHRGGWRLGICGGDGASRPGSHPAGRGAGGGGVAAALPGRRRDARDGHRGPRPVAAGAGPRALPRIPHRRPAGGRERLRLVGRRLPAGGCDDRHIRQRELGTILEPGDEDDMARRLGWLVGAAAILLVLARLTQVLEPAADTPDWRLIVPAAALGGILVTWATARLSPDRQVAIHLIALAVRVLRITASDTLRFGIVPTSETLPALAERMAYAAEIVRFGAPPVLAVIGLVALAAVGLWSIGAVWAWSVTSGRTWAGIAAPLGFYLY